MYYKSPPPLSFRTLAVYSNSLLATLNARKRIRAAGEALENTSSGLSFSLHPYPRTGTDRFGMNTKVSVGSFSPTSPSKRQASLRFFPPSCSSAPRIFRSKWTRLKNSLPTYQVNMSKAILRARELEGWRRSGVILGWYSGNPFLVYVPYLLTYEYMRSSHRCQQQAVMKKKKHKKRKGPSPSHTTINDTPFPFGLLG